MLFTRVRIALLVCSFVAVAVLTARADDKTDDKKPEPIPAPKAPPAAAAPAYKTVCVTEWVPETYTGTRTVYKKECVPEKYTAYRTECTAECKTRTCTFNRVVSEWVEEARTVCVCTPVQEERTVMKKVVTCVPVTTMVCKTVDNGHWECKEVACGPTLTERLHGLLGKLKRHHDCGCESACGDSCGGCETACAPRTKTVKVWVSCKTTVQVPCTRMERKVECVPEKCMVTVNKMVPTTKMVKVCKTRCVPETKTETYTVMVPHKVAYEATRMVTKCVPVTEKYTCCKMVARQVEKQVACDTGCGESCCEEHHRGGFLQGLLHKRSCCH
jgi:hypothetical protein